MDIYTYTVPMEGISYITFKTDKESPCRRRGKTNESNAVNNLEFTLPPFTNFLEKFI